METMADGGTKHEGLPKEKREDGVREVVYEEEEEEEKKEGQEERRVAGRGRGGGCGTVDRCVARVSSGSRALAP